MSNSVRPRRRQPTRLPCPWESPGKNTGVGCHFLLQWVKVKSESEVTQSCPTYRSHGLQPPRLLRPWDFPGKSTGVGRQCLLQYSEAVLGNSHFYATITTIHPQNSFYPAKLKLDTNYGTISTTLLATTIPLSVSLNLTTLVLYITGIIQYLSFSDWLISLNIVLHCSPMLQHVSKFPSFRTEFHYMYILPFAYPNGSFLLLAIVNNITINVF